jgi:hypothetical protein
VLVHRCGDPIQVEKLTIKQTSTGYWVVQRGAVSLAGAMTRHGAEAERDLRDRLHTRSLARDPGAGGESAGPADGPDLGTSSR